MIKLHRLNGVEFILNDDHIETIEAKPDTTLILSNERMYIVTEPVEEVLKMIIRHKRSMFLEEPEGPDI